MKDVKLVRGPPDWNLPIEHEEILWGQYVGGGRTFLDIGAHVGTWSIHLSPFFERIFAFEPDPRGWQTLAKNLELNGVTNVEIVTKAVTNKSGTITFHTYECPSTNSIMDPVAIDRADAPIGSLIVEAITVDDFVRSRGIDDVDFVKIDTEAAEMLVLEGAQQTFRKQTPDFSIEMHGFFYERLRKLLSFMETDVLDGGRWGFTLSKHRESWPGLTEKGFDIYPHGVSPDKVRMKALRDKQGMPYDLDLKGFRAADHTGHVP